MSILINKTYQTTTPESVEAGDFEDTGFAWENVPHSFRELVDEMRSYSEASSWPVQPDSWLTSEADIDYQTGETISYSLHPANREPRTMRYWEKALRAAGYLL